MIELKLTAEIEEIEDEDPDDPYPARMGIVKLNGEPVWCMVEDIPVWRDEADMASQFADALAVALRLPQPIRDEAHDD